MTEFESWLRKGLGRAAVVLKREGGQEHRGPLMYACTRNITYDRQCEEERGPYLLDLIRLSGEPEFYRHCVITAMGCDDEDQDLGQLFELGAHFASSGDIEMKRAIYAAFERNGFAGAGVGCAEQLVVLDGVNGLRFAMASFGGVEADDRPWQFGHLVDRLKRHHGDQALPADLDPFVKEWEEDEKRCELARQQPRPRPSYEALKQSMTRAGAMGWARTASAQELAAAARDLNEETDEAKLVCYLRMFQFRAFPGSPDRLLKLAIVNNRDVARASLVALANVTDERVRALGLALIEQRKWIDFAVGLLVRNAEPGDYRIIEHLLADTSDEDAYHRLGIDVRHFVEAHRSEDAERSLLLLYENGPCSMCRYGVVKELLAIDRLPASLWEECDYDAYSETRRLVSPDGASEGPL